MDDERLGSDVAFLEAVLTNPASSVAVRRGASDRLVRDRSPEAMQAVERALRAKDAAVVSSAVDALDRAEAHAPALADALVAVIASDVAIDRGAAARVLAASDTRATELLAAAANASPTVSARVGAIKALGELRTRQAAGRLVAMLDEKNQSPEILQAACLALDLATGAGHGTDPSAWRNWWADSSRVAMETGALSQDSQLRARAEAAERAAADERGRSERLAGRLVEIYGQLFLYLTQRDRFERSVDLLSDSLAEVRTFGVAQIERMLRNGERADDTIYRAVMVLLDDPVPALRVRGVRLLDDLAAPDLALRISERLPNERDPDVTAAYLTALANRPSNEAFSATLPLVRDPVYGEAASRVLNRLIDTGVMPLAAFEKVLPSLREVVAARPNGAAAQLLALTGDDTDLQKVTALLDATDPAVRRGAAEGLRRRGVRRPIFDRASDPAIYSQFIAALADEPTSAAGLERLAASLPPADMVSEWNAMLVRMLRELPLADLLSADRLLEPIAACEAKTRLVGLTRLAGASRAGLPRSDLESGLRRFVDLSIADSRGDEAITFLIGLNPQSGEATRDALFRAYALNGNFREAAGLDAGAGSWLGLLASVITDAMLARPIADEIALRFAVDSPRPQFTKSEQETFDRLRRSLPATPAAATAPPDGASGNL